MNAFSDIEAELDLSIESSAAWLEELLERVDLSEDDIQGLEIIIENLYDSAQFIRDELGIGGEQEEEEEEEHDSHLSYIQKEDEDHEEADEVTFWASGITSAF